MSTILAIDDQKDNLITITALLKNLKPDCRVITAESGREGLELAAGELPDVIILDVRMPGMDGYETCSRLKSMEQTRHIPVILLTAMRTDAESRIRGLELGADAFLTKPVDESELVAQINVMLRIKYAEDLLRKEKNILEDLVLERTRSLIDSELKLKKERDFLKSLEDASPAYYVAVSPRGTVLSMNRSLLEVLGYGTSDVKGKDYFTDFISAPSREGLKKIHEETPPGKTTVFECPIITGSGDEVLVEWHIRSFHGENGEVDFIFSVGIDITERKSLEKTIINANERERHAISQDIHARLGNFLTGVAFKSEILRLKMKERSYDEAKEMEDVVNMIHQSIDQTRDLARNLCPVDMSGGGLRTAVEDMRVEIEQDTGTSCLLQWDDEIDISDDLLASNLFYIIKEAVDNAITHGNAGNIIISLSGDAGSIVLSLEDDGTGPGNAPETIEGLGIKIMRYRAWIIGASIELKRNRGGGLTVTCVLPRRKSGDTTRISDAQSQMASERRTGRIFIIDESPVVRQGLMQIIGGREDLQVCGEAKNSDEAIRQIARTNPDLVIIDIAIEGVGGIDLIKALKSRYPSLEILVLSDHDESMYAERSLRAGAGGYIMKRESSQKVLQALGSVIEGRQYLSDRMKEEILGKISRINPDRATGVEKLSNREFEIFQLIGKGLGNRNIAEKMNISVKTVENYRERIKSKLNFDNSQTLVQFAVQWMINRPA